MDNLYDELLNEAKKVSENAYTPYSKFKVGACALFESNKRYIGCNVENASYGLSLCAERNAIANAISNGEKTKIKAIAIYSPNQSDCLPCGACRQWMSEFSAKDAVVILNNKNNENYTLAMSEIFPYPFKIDE